MDGYLSGMGEFNARPPWNESWMLAVGWLSVVPLAAMLFGLVAAARNSDEYVRRSLRFAAACIGVYLAAMLLLFLELPVASTAKASYTLGLVPCYVLLAVGGLEILTRWFWLRAVVFAGIGCWAVFSYTAYFVMSAGG
jgi:hypothetical protein